MNTFIYNIIMGLSRSNYRLFFLTFPHFLESSAINPHYFYAQERKNRHDKAIKKREYTYLNRNALCELGDHIEGFVVVNKSFISKGGVCWFEMNVNLSSLKRLRECLWRKPRVRHVWEPTPACAGWTGPAC